MQRFRCFLIGGLFQLCLLANDSKVSLEDKVYLLERDRDMHEGARQIEALREQMRVLEGEIQKAVNEHNAKVSALLKGKEGCFVNRKKDIECPKKPQQSQQSVK